MTIVKRFLVSLAAFSVLASVLVAVTSAPASAAYSQCPVGVACLWTGENGQGSRLNLPFSSSGPVGTCRNINPYPVDAYNSARGGYGSGYGLTIYSGTGCSGFLRILYYHPQWDTYDTWSSAFTAIRSYRIQ